MTSCFSPSAQSSLSEWLDYLMHLHSSAIDLGLERVQAVAERAKLTHPAPKVITVAGTNGKGSTCAMMEAILLAAGYRVGVYSSPHLVTYNERVRINGKMLPDDDHCRAFAAIDYQRAGISLSLFEFGTLAALWLFNESPLDVVILEVGLGGRLDATNVVDHDVSVITSLAIDHVDWLGDDIEGIGFEKAGIFRGHRPAICGQSNPPPTVAAHADDISATLYQVGYQFDYEITGDTWHWHSGAFELTNLPIPSLPLPNAATALMALSVSGLTVTDEQIVRGLSTVTLAGRLQILQSDPLVVLDVAHNPHSANYLASQLPRLKAKYCVDRVFGVIGMLHDKDIAGTVAEMLPVVDRWYPVDLTGARAAKADEIAAFLPKGSFCYGSPQEGYQAALTEATTSSMVIVFGSFYTVGEISNPSVKN